MAVAELESVRQHGIMHPTLGDVVWPALILEGRILTWYAIAAGLAAEYLFVRSVTDLSLTWALAADVAMNAASTLLGVVLLPVVGLVWEFLPGRVINSVFNTGTFNPGSWLATICFRRCSTLLSSGSCSEGSLGSRLLADEASGCCSLATSSVWR